MPGKDEEFLKRLVATFRAEARDYIQAIASGLVELESASPEETKGAVLDAIFRAAHSLKGAARAVDSRDVETVCQSLEKSEQLKYMLEEHDFQVAVARNGQEGLDALRQHKPTLVITDVTMPGIDGYELCRRIRADEQMAELPVILLTGLSDPEDVFKGLECGADNFITKPYERNNLLARIHYLLANIHLRHREKVQSSMEVLLAGRKHVITSDRAQILNLLLSTYEAAVQKNGELAKARDELAKLNRGLEEKVLERTASLVGENAERRRAEAEVRKLNEDLEQRVRERTGQLEAANKK